MSLTKEDVIKIILEDESQICVRPVGTKPKYKPHCGVCTDTDEEAEEVLQELENAIMDGIVKECFVCVKLTSVI